MRARRSVKQRAFQEDGDSLPASLHPVIRRILLARQISDEAGLDLELGRLEPPDTLSGIGQAARLLADALSSDKKLLVVGDFDADGATGTAVAVKALRLLGARHVDFKVPNRFEFGYGLSAALVATLADDPPDLLITVDSGISSIDGVAAARKLGCQVIVTDHHIPGDILPDADAIVNPNCPGDEFPSKALAGVGVVFYLMCVLRSELRARNWFTQPRQEPNLATLLDLVALGTVADLVPLDRNNRVLVRHGIERIRRGLSRPGLMALLRLGKRDYRFVVASDLAFAVAPRLNAAGRLEDMSVGIRCLLTDDAEEAMAIATELDDLNHQRRGRQKQMQQQALDQVKSLVESLRENTPDNQELPSAVCLFDQNWHQGIVGLVASKIKDAVHRPVIAFAPESAGSDMIKGSARSVKGLHIRDALARVDARNPKLMTAFGGHAMAAGLSMPLAGFDKFKAAMDEAIDYFLQGRTLSNDLLTDGELTPADINLDFAQLLGDLGPWGQQFPEPLFEGRFVVEEQRVVGGAHLKMMLRPVYGHELIDAIAFGKLPEDLPPTDTVGFVYKLDINHFRGRKTCQLMIEKIID